MATHPSTAELRTPNVDPMGDRHELPLRPSGTKPTIIGIYGVGGSGKSTVVSRLKEILGNTRFNYYDGSAKIAQFVQNFPEDLQALDQQGKYDLRARAITAIRDECLSQNRIGIVSGHYFLWEEDENAMPEPECAWTNADQDIYTQIFYLSPEPSTILEFRSNDVARTRNLLSAKHITKWQNKEKKSLQELCMNSGIQFASFESPSPTIVNAIKQQVLLVMTKEDVNLSRLKERVDSIIEDSGKLVETILVLDADKTIAPQDSGKLLWERVSPHHDGDESRPIVLKDVFEENGGYTYHAFRKISELLETHSTQEEYVEICRKVSSEIEMYPTMKFVLDNVRGNATVKVLVLTCGPEEIWKQVLNLNGMSDRVDVIGSGRLSNSSIITGEVKATLVSHLKTQHGMFVWAIGDSPLDLDMMKTADQAIVAVGDENGRSRSMDDKLEEAIAKDGLQARQVVLGKGARPRLDTTRVPLIDLDRKFIKLLGRHTKEAYKSDFEATDTNAGRLLSTASRNATISGPALQQAHHDIGKYLATRFVSKIVGVEEYHIPHVQGNFTSGFRFAHEQRILIVALMRAGQSIAAGVNEAMPLAAFLHAKEPSDLTPEYLNGRRTIILADAVINNGTTTSKFIKSVRAINSTVRIIVVTGVAQAGCLESEGELSDAFKKGTNNYLVTLRKSDNKYTGRGGTDTGHRLFNTTFRD